MVPKQVFLKRTEVEVLLAALLYWADVSLSFSLYLYFGKVEGCLPLVDEFLCATLNLRMMQNTCCMKST